MSYLSRMIEMLTGAYNREDRHEGTKRRTNIGRLFALLAWGLEAVEDSAQRIRLWDDLDEAQGAVLDRYGNNYGVERQGTADLFYRLLIKVKMIAQLSGGDINTVLEAVAALYGLEPTALTIQERFPAKLRVFINNDPIAQDKIALTGLIGQVVKRIVAAGVGIELVYRTHRPVQAQVGLGAVCHLRFRHRAVLSRIDKHTVRQQIQLGGQEVHRSHRHQVGAPRAGQ